MATVIPEFSSTQVISNLDTYTYTVKSAAVHYASAQLEALNLPSSLALTISQSGSRSASVSSPAMAAGQSVLDLSASFNCAAGDVISFVISSSAASDQAINSIKGILNIHIGSSN